MKVSYNWLKDYLGDSLPAPQEVADLLTQHSFEIDGIDEIEGDTVIDVDILPNRSSDSLCHRGVARELASILDITLENDPLQQKPELSMIEDIAIDIADKNACPRFSAALMTGVEIKESPDWLKARLEALGVRSINNIVDATNYVMYAIGEPLHAYDADLFPQVDGKWQFSVRFAKEGEEVSLLAEGGKDEDRIVTCQGTELLIVDGSSDTPIGMAGVKGGRFAGVHAGTKNIIIEAAHFHPTITRKTARRLGIVIDASKRFENEPSRELTMYALRDVIELIKDIAGGEFVGAVDEYLEAKTNPTVNVTLKKTNSLLGLSLTLEQVADILKRIGAQVEVGKDSLQVQGPWERTDLLIEEDFIEEVGRLYGLDNITSVVPEAASLTEINARQYYSDLIRHTLTETGFSEVITSSFHKKGKIQLQNALASDKSYVRGNLKKNLHDVLDKNFVHCDLLGVNDIRVFEIGTVFTPGEDGVEEHILLAIGARVKGSGYSGADDKVLKLACDAISEAVSAELEWDPDKGVVETNFSELLSKLPEPEAYAKYEKSPAVAYQPPSVYPAISRDIALWVNNNETAESVREKLVGAAGALLVRDTLFDTFEKEGRVSYAFRFVFQSRERTLTDSEINTAMEGVYATAKENGWEVR